VLGRCQKLSGKIDNVKNLPKALKESLWILWQARNYMRAMKVGQEAFFYHSNCKNPGLAGLMKIVKESYVDHTQFDKGNVVSYFHCHTV
jgi:predicted RNA-binding protein with PUA-like domain